MNGTVKYIFTTSEAGNKMQLQDRASLVAGKGIEGDRYFWGQGTFSERLHGKPDVELTLIEKEEIDKFNAEQNLQIGYGDFRRSIVTEGIRLNDLVGHSFRIGDVQLKGIRLCEPCPHLQKSVNPLVLPHLVGRGGLRAQILTSGLIRPGDRVAT